MSRTNIDIDETLIRKARQITRLKTKREIVDKALEFLLCDPRPAKVFCAITGAVSGKVISRQRGGITGWHRHCLFCRRPLRSQDRP